MHEIEPLRAAVEHGDVLSRLETRVKSLDRPHAKTLVGPEDIADAQDKDFRRADHSADSSLKMRSPETIEEMMLCRLTMSSRIAA